MRLHLVLPAGVDDPRRPSGGNVYDRRVSRGLEELGWTVCEHPVPAGRPRSEGPDSGRPDAGTDEQAGLAAVLDGVSDHATVLVDGLVASAAPLVVVPAAGRLRLAVLVHLPLGVGSEEARPAEREVLTSAGLVVTTSHWCRRWLLEHYALPACRVVVAAPGVDAADPAAGSPSGGSLLCVGAVTPAKGHDVLLAALGSLLDLEWRCRVVGPLDVDPGFAASLRRRASRDGMDDRVEFTGPLTGGDLGDAYAAADLLVTATRVETYGMVVAEALARGVPVVATRVGGVPEALGRVGRARPGVLVPPGDAPALAGALRRWLADPVLRARLAATARRRRETLPGWRRTSALLAESLGRLSRDLVPGPDQTSCDPASG